MRKLFRLLFGLPARNHFFGSFAIVLIVGMAISVQMTDRRNFADSELHRDVMERWGAPIVQPTPSLRYVPSGTVFNALLPLSLRSQDVAVDATMNYRKRGLVYFSGFDFAFRGDYSAGNDQGRDIDVAFVFPINLEKNKVLLSDLTFTVNGKAEKVELPDGADKLVWTGRLKSGEKALFHVAFRGRGLDSFTYLLDPAAPVENFRLAFHIAGGDHFDYGDGMVPAAETRVTGDQVSLAWEYRSLQSGIPVGVILPSEESFDALIATMVGRAWAPFLLFFLGMTTLALHHGRRLQIHESYLLAACYGLFFVLLAYLAAFTNFYVAWALALGLIGGLIYGYVRVILSSTAARYALGLLASFLVVPTVAVMLQGYTGLIYTLEVTALVASLMFLTTHSAARRLLDELARPAAAQGGEHVA